MQRCPGCGEENPDRFRLCGFCGTALAVPVAPSEVRKTVTVVFSDLVGSTSLGEHLDSEALREVLAEYFATMRAVLERHGGLVEKYIGDAIMAVFGLPRMHEDDALRAVRAAAEMRAALPVLNDRLAARWGVRLANRTGVNTGEVVAGDPTTGQRLATGDVVNVAARLEQAAPPTEVLLGPDTYRLVRDATLVEAVPPLELKGKAEPMPAYLLQDVLPGEAISRRVDTPLVGREDELGALRRQWERTTDGRAARVTLLGDAGLGKSRLVAEFVREVAPATRVLRGQCVSYGEGITFLPLVEVLRAGAGIPEHAEPDAARSLLGDLLGADAEVATRIGSILGLSEERYAREELFWAARRALEALSRHRALVVVLDDIHWAEPTFLDLVDEVLDRWEGGRLLLLCAARHELEEERPDWGTASALDLRIVLRELDELESAAVIRNLLGGAHLPPPLEARVVAAAEGNPLFVEQLLAMLEDDGFFAPPGEQRSGWGTPGPAPLGGTPETPGPSGGPTPLPPGPGAPASPAGASRAWSSEDWAGISIPKNVAALLAARLDRLSATERSVLERASVSGVEFNCAAVRALEPGAAADLSNPLASLVAKRLVEPLDEAPHGEGSYRFRHGLVRDAAYGGLLKRTRAQLHERFAAWLREPGSVEASSRDELVGYHLEQAWRYRAELGPLDAEGWAIGAEASARLATAGRRAVGRGDMPAAVNLLERAAGVLAETDPTRPRLLTEAGEALLEIGELALAEARLAEARDAAGAVGDERGRRLAELDLLYLHYTTAPQGGGERVLEQVRAQLPGLEADGDDEALARAWRLLAYAEGIANRFGASADAAERTIRHAVAAGDEVLAHRFLGAFAVAALYGPTPVAEAIERCEEVLARALGDCRAQALTELALAHLEAMGGDFSSARARYTRSRASLERFGWTLLAALTSIDSAPIELLAGDLAAAEQELRRDYAALDQMGERNYISTTAGLLAEVLYRQGRLDEADELARRCAELADPEDVASQFLWRSAAGKVAARRGDDAMATRLVGEALLLIEASDQLDWQGDAHANLAEVHAAAGRADEAARAWARAVELYERKGDLVAAARARASADLDTSGSDLGTGGAGPGPGQADLAISGASLGAGEAELGAGGTGRLSRLV